MQEGKESDLILTSGLRQYLEDFCGFQLSTVCSPPFAQICLPPPPQDLQETEEDSDVDVVIDEDPDEDLDEVPERMRRRNGEAIFLFLIVPWG